MKSLENIPFVRSRTRKTTRLITIQSIILIGIVILLLVVIAIPLAIVFSEPEKTSTSSTTTVTTVTTTTVTTATTTSSSSTTSTDTTTTQTTTTITASLTVFGPQINFDPTTLSTAWSMCYSGLYSTPIFPNITSILSTCYKAKLLLGCRPVGNALLTLAAMGNRADVLYDCSASSTTTRIANGVAWYYAVNVAGWNSWGFVRASDTSNRNNCDGDMSTNPAYRLCWHMISNAGGWRCGSTGSLDTSTTWERVIYHAM